MKLLKIMQVSIMPISSLAEMGNVEYYKYRLYYDQLVEGQTTYMTIRGATLLANSLGIQIIK